MKKNSKQSGKMSVVLRNTYSFGLMGVLLLSLLFVNLFATTRCDQLLKAKGELERELRRLDDAWMRESTRWEEMKTPERIEVALMRHGLKMHHPKPEQTVQMRADGTPYPVQLSITRARQRGALTPARTQYRRAGSR